MKKGRPALREHQVKAVAYADENPYCILALDPRLGKSRCGIEIQQKYKMKCLVICPSYLVDNWAIEIRKWVDNPKIKAIHAGKDIKPVDADYIIISYTLAQKAEEYFEWADMVILDEAPAIKSMSTKRSQFIHRVIYENSIKRVILMTGTPIKNRVQEFYSLLALTFYNPNVADGRFLDLYPDEITFADQFSFSESYEIEINNKFVTINKWSGIRNTKELKEWLVGRYIRIRDTDVLDMPEVSTKDVLISEIADPKLLDAFYKGFADESEKWEMTRKERTGSVMPEHKAAAALKKVKFTIDYAKDLLEQVDCVLIYSDHIDAATVIANEFDVQPITGLVPAVKRGKMADKFQAGEGRVLVATIGSLKEGKDLYRANHLIFNDLCWVPGDLKQVVNRIRVVGKKTKCTIHRIFGSPQDEYIGNTLDEKIDTIEKAT